MARIMEPDVQAPLKYALTPLFFGVTTGPIYGGVTGIMMNMGGTAALQTRVLRHTLLFCSTPLLAGRIDLG